MSKEEENTTTEPQQPVFLDQNGNPIPFFKQEKNTHQKTGYQFGLFSFLGLLATLILLGSLTPLYSLVIRITPSSVQEALLSPLFRSISLYEKSQKFDAPIKVQIPEPGTLPVLSFDTGICFSFYSTINETNQNYIDDARLKAAKHGKPIAEIIAVGAEDKYEYRLETTSLNETIDKNHKPMSVICQKMGRAYGSTPKSINALYIRPIKPFMAEKAAWNSIKHLYNEYSSPLEPETNNTP